MPYANLLWQHPMGDIVKVPCQHLQLKQTGTHDISAPTGITIGKEHDHDTVKDPLGGNHDVPCVHLNSQVKTGTMKIPVYALTPEHPAGDDSPLPAPCVHPLPVQAVDAVRHLVFYTDDKNFRDIAIDLVDKLTALHVRSAGSTWRPLLFFFREALGGNPNNSKDPFWSHYDPNLHAIQITRNPAGINYNFVRSTLAHELGHAIVGQSCVRVPNEGDPHSMQSPSHPGEAMSEGWADFVQVALSRDGRATPGRPTGGSSFSFENRDAGVPKTKDIEYNVMCLLWDLFDTATTHTLNIAGTPTVIAVPDDDPASTPATAFLFEELYGVFSPSLQTLPAGPTIWDIDDYLSRLKAEYPGRASSVDGVRALHLN